MADDLHIVDAERDIRQLLQAPLRNDLRSQVYAQILNRLINLPVKNINVYDIDNALPDVLPYLAYQFAILGYRGWKFVDGEASQRSLLKKAIPLQRLTGSIKGYREVAKLSGAKLKAYVIPPNTAYCGRSWTIEERNQFLDLMPKLRTYRFLSKGQRKGFFVGDFVFPLGYDSPINHAPTSTNPDVLRRYYEQVYYISPDGERSPLTSYTVSAEFVEREAVVTRRVRLPGQAVGVFPVGAVPDGVTKQPGSFEGKLFTRRSDAAKRLYTINYSQPYQEKTSAVHKQTIRPALDQVSVQYDLIREKGQHRCMIAGHIYPGAEEPKFSIACRSTAPQRLYKQVSLHDPSVDLLPGNRSQFFVGVTRLGLRPYRAELQVEKRYERDAAWFTKYLTGFLRPNTQEEYLDIVRSTNEYRLARDELMVTTQTRRTKPIGNSAKVGATAVGQIEEFTRGVNPS